MNKQRVLFLCTHNAARSQMAEALLRKHAGEHFEVVSAGLEPTTVHPLTICAMKEIGLDISGQRSKGLDEFLGKTPVQIAIVVCEQAQKNCPRIFPFAMERLCWPFEDPAACNGTEAERLQKFRDVRGQIEAKILEWLKTSTATTGQ
jgi:arsenate reductase